MATEDRTIRVGLVEDTADERDILVTLLEGAAGVELVGAHAGAAAALRAIAAEKPHVMLVDLEMPGMSGVEFLRACRERFPEVECIALTKHDVARWVFPALEAGASGYLVKGASSAAKILEAIAEVHAGGAAMSSEVARLVLGAFRGKAREHADVATLSRREREVVDLLAQGLTYDEIASQLGVSSRTVNTHLHHTYAKLHVHSATGAVGKLLGCSGATSAD
ncbi:MAG: response regulator transcription factor [Planctomycetes bacterium]|nr:response regulator transcription factor [Planctomycetota bacterium]